MATVGQIIYNVEDYNSSGGYISTAMGNTSKIVSSADKKYNNDFSEYQKDIIDIFNQNLVSLYSSNKFSKLGIQAPSGTKVILNDNKEIMIGRTGVYELNENINITNLKFIRPKKYILDEAQTAAELDEGKRLLREAEEFRENALIDLDNRYTEKNEQYWNEYIEIQNEYTVKYDSALSRYTIGINGIYILPNPDNIEADENYEILYNVIIDFLY